MEETISDVYEDVGGEEKREKVIFKEEGPSLGIGWPTRRLGVACIHASEQAGKHGTGSTDAFVVTAENPQSRSGVGHRE